MKKLIERLKELRKAECNILIVLIRFVYWMIFYKVRIIAHQKVRIKNVNKIIQDTMDILYIGTQYVGFQLKNDRTLLNIQGILHLKGSCNIKRGVRIDICENGMLILGDNVRIANFTKIIAKNTVIIGNNTCIGWDCQIMDDNFHSIDYENKKYKGSEIRIGDNVLIANKVSIYKSVNIANGSVIASNSVIMENINDPNQLITTNQRIKILKQNVKWN